MSGYRLLKTAVCGIVLFVTTAEAAGGKNETRSISHHSKKYLKKKTVCENGQCREVLYEDDEEVEDCRDGVCVRRKKHGETSPSGSELSRDEKVAKAIAAGAEEISSLLSTSTTQDQKTTQVLLNEIKDLLKDNDGIPKSKWIEILKGEDLDIPEVKELLDVAIRDDGVVTEEKESSSIVEKAKSSNLRKGNMSSFMKDGFADDFFSRSASSFFGQDSGDFFSSALKSFGKDEGTGSSKTKVDKFASEQSVSFSSKQTRVPVTKADIEKNPNLAGEKFHQVDVSSITCRGRDSKGKDYQIVLSKKVVDGVVVEDIEKTEGLNDEQLKESLSRVFQDMPKAKELFPEAYAKYAN